MKLTPLFDFELRYTDLEVLDFGAGGQLYGSLEGFLEGERLRGALRVTNVAPMRPDDVNLPTVRGLLTTDDGAKVWVAMDGLALARSTDGARVVTAAITFRTGDPRYAWLNTIFAVTEGVLNTVAAGGAVHHRVYRCEPTLGSTV
jgi:Protein of unknown function (DUF3237)